MQHPYDALRPEYALLWSTMQVRDPAAVEAIARKLLMLRDRYVPVRAATGVPVVWLMSVDERESGADGQRYLGNGDPLTAPTKDVPRGRGPFPNWPAGAIDSVVYDRIDQVPGWSVERALYEAEAWNGWGPRGHGIHTGYNWAGTQHYEKGKYVRDGQWDPNFEDKQIGVAPLIKHLVLLDAALLLPMEMAAAGEPPQTPADPPPGGNPEDAKWIQARLNLAGQEPPLLIDGNFGKKTRRALLDFQYKHGLKVDGLVGPKTMAALEQVAGQGTSP